MKKTLHVLVMVGKYYLYGFVFQLLFLNLMYASPTKGQSSLDIKEVYLNLDLQEASLPATFNAIKAQSGFSFIYDQNLVERSKPVDLQVRNQSLEYVLLSLAASHQLSFKQVDNRISVKEMEKNRKEETVVLEITINGTVTDASGEPIPGVTVSIQGTSTGTATDMDGRYSIVAPEGSTLVFSFIGFETQQIAVANQTVVNVTLMEDMASLEEVVVVGYGTQKKANLTGAVSTISSSDIENRPVSNVALALQGLSPGLSVTRATGQPGDEGIGIQVRGATSANGNVEPLLIIDGVSSPGVSLQTINPNDIESISVLKDAAAAAIYGAQAAGGVILITTKKGVAGKTIFEYSSIVGLDWALNVPERMHVWEELEHNNLARLNSGAAAAHSEETIQILKEGKIQYRINPNDSTRYQYYNTESIVDQLLKKNTLMQTHNISARGGDEKINFLISVGYHNKEGIFKVGPDRNDRYNMRLNLGTKLSRHLSLDSRINYTLQKQEASSVNVNGNGALLFNLYRYSSINPLLTPEGRYNTTTGATAYAEMDGGGYNNYNRNFLDGVFTARVAEVVKGLELRAVYGMQYRRGDRHHFRRTVERWYRTVVGSVINDPNSYTVSNDLTQNNNLQFLLDYDYSIGTDHKFHVMGGYQWEDSRSEFVSTGVTALVNNELPALGLGDETTKTNTQRINTYAFQSYFGRFNYSYDEKYLVEATFRVDESSRLAPGLRTKAFPSVSIGWNIDRESWFQVPVLSEFKLRGSWGRLGAASGIGLYDYLALINQGSNLVLGYPEVKTTYFSQTTVPSSRLSWETIETTNGGLDFGLFSNKLQGSVDYYVKYNRNMLTALQLPSTFGVGTPRINNGELKSWGWEGELRYRNKAGSDFSYSVAVNVSDNQNELLNFSGRKVISSGTVGTLEGYPLNTIWGYISSGYFQTADEVEGWAFQDSRTGPGDLRYIDQNSDGRISVGSGTIDDPGDLVYLGTTQPRLLFGLNFSARWKGFDFSAFVQGVGERNFLPTRQALDPNIASYYQALAIHRDYWTPENPDAMFPRPYVGATHNFLVSDKWVLNGSYARLKNLQIGYSLPSSFISKLKLSTVRVYFTGQDLFTLSGLGVFSGYFDPEQRDGVSADYPFFATGAMGVNISF